jgi:acetoin utilization protein AcuB
MPDPKPPTGSDGGPTWPRSASAEPPERPRVVRDIMSDAVVKVAPSVEATRAIDLANERHVEHLVVARGEELLGVLCTCDLWDAVRSSVGSCMSSPPVTVDADAPLWNAVEIVRTTGVGCLPVVDDGVLVGVVTRGDHARHGLLDLTDQTCESCGTHHHVRRLPGYEHAFCTQCLDKTPASLAPYEELGWGD